MTKPSERCYRSEGFITIMLSNSSVLSAGLHICLGHQTPLSYCSIEITANSPIESSVPTDNVVAT